MRLDALLTETSWRRVLSEEFGQPYFSELSAFMQQRCEQNAVIYPSQQNIFSAFNLTPISAVKVVILGQDPYHGEGQAMGLSFSVPEGVKLPPSLKNIFAEIKDDIGGTVRKNGNLTDWARQGILLLNSVLTVEEGAAAAHAGQGWEVFTDKAISQLNAENDGVVYLLWGAYAQRKAALIDADKNKILTAPHPSPLSAYRGFFGCRHFSKANDYLESKNAAPIQWG